MDTCAGEIAMSICARLHQIDVGLAVDQRHDAPGPHALGHQAGHDVVLVVVGQREIQIHVVDVLGFEQHFVRGIARQAPACWAGGSARNSARLLRMLDQLDLVVLFERRRER
jgi:hypothetical protein